MSIKQKVKRKYQRDGLKSLIASILSRVEERIFATFPAPLRKAILKRTLKDREELHEYWRSRSGHERNSPELYLRPVERSEFLVSLLEPYVDASDRIVEPGCNVGRNLYYLYENGYTELTGIEINTQATTILEDEFPELAEEAVIYNGEIERILPELEDDKFDVCITMAVLEHIHPDSEFVFEELTRVTSSYIVTIEDESVASSRHVPRDYEAIFTAFDFEQVESVSGERFPDGVDLSESYVARVFKREVQSGQ